MSVSKGCCVALGLMYTGAPPTPLCPSYLPPSCRVTPPQLTRRRRRVSSESAAAIGISHLKDPHGSLKDFGVQGEISPIAAHCCAIIGATSVPVAAMLLFAATAAADVRAKLIMCYLLTIPPGILVQVWYPFNSPAPEPPADMPYPIIILQVVLGLVALLANGAYSEAQINSWPWLQLHGYQKDFLAKMAQAQGLGSDGAALQSIVYQAMSSASIKAAIFDDFHCVHCGSKNPPAWINDRKGHEAVALDISDECVVFLSQTILVAVGPPGPSKAVKPDEPKRADAHKAARCCIDWAIKEYGDAGKAKGK